MEFDINERVESELEQLKRMYVDGELSDVEYFLEVDKIGEDRYIGVIKWPPALENERRGRESESYRLFDIERQRLGIYRTTRSKVCMFCNPPQSVDERGICDASLKLVSTKGQHKGEVVGWSCEQCLDGLFVEKR